MAKQIVYGEEARKALEKGVNQLADTVAGGLVQQPGPAEHKANAHKKE